MVGFYWILFPYAPEERGLFVSQSLERQWWLYIPGSGCNLPALLSLMAIVAIITCVAAPRISRTAVLAFGGSSIVLSVASFWVDDLTAPAAQFYSRHNSAFLSFAVMILVMIARDVPDISFRMSMPPVRSIIMVLGIATSLWHVQATKKWSAFLANFRNVLASNRGIIPATVLLQPSNARSADVVLDESRP
jgi:hypothetical protein